MRISELPTDRGLDVLIEIMPYVKKLAECESLTGLFEDVAKTTEDERGAETFAAMVLEKLVPIWLKDCREELLAIIGVIDGMSDEDIQEMGALKAFERMGELFNDTDFVVFFRSFVAIQPKR